MVTRHVAGALALSLIVLGGCSYPGMVKLSPDTYRLSRADAGHVYADTAALKAAAVAEAAAFARSKGMVAEEVAVHEDTLQVGHLATIDYDFRLVAPGAPPAAAPVMAPVASRAPVMPPAAPAAPVAPVAPVTPVTQVAPAVPASPAAAPHRDYYDELIRLDDLRKRGILTEDEFQTLKAKILAGR